MDVVCLIWINHPWYKIQPMKITSNTTRFEKSLLQLISYFDLEITINDSPTTGNDTLRRVSTLKKKKKREQEQKHNSFLRKTELQVDKGEKE